MAKYVERIKVSSGETWPVRDAETEGRVTILESTIAKQDEAISTMEGKVITAEEKVLSLENTIEDLVNQSTGSVLTEPLILTEDVHYGVTLPEPGIPGRIFFKKVTT